MSETFSENEVRAVSGHKTNSCLGIYNRMRPEKFADLSDHLNSAFTGASSSQVPTVLSSAVDGASVDQCFQGTSTHVNFDDMPVLSQQECVGACDTTITNNVLNRDVVSNNDMFRLGNTTINNYGTINFHVQK